ncbi:hypothetical protein D3C78_1923810 [compost metagenome]
MQRASVGSGGELGVEDQVRLIVQCQCQLQAGSVQRAAQIAGQEDVVFGFLQLQTQAGRQQGGAGVLQL